MDQLIGVDTDTPAYLHLYEVLSQSAPRHTVISVDDGNTCSVSDLVHGTQCFEVQHDVGTSSTRIVDER